MTTEEQKQAVNAASARVLESCHCMHCNELLITLSVWDTDTQLATLAQSCLCVLFFSFFYFRPSYGAIACVFACVCARDFLGNSSRQMSVDRTTETVFHISDERMKQRGFQRR